MVNKTTLRTLVWQWITFIRSGHSLLSLQGFVKCTARQRLSRHPSLWRWLTWTRLEVSLLWPKGGVRRCWGSFPILSFLCWEHLSKRSVEGKKAKMRREKWKAASFWAPCRPQVLRQLIPEVGSTSSKRIGLTFSIHSVMKPFLRSVTLLSYRGSATFVCPWCSFFFLSAFLSDPILYILIAKSGSNF